MRAIIITGVNNNRPRRFNLPNVPMDVKLSYITRNRELPTLGGLIRVVAPRGLRTTTWSSFVPGETTDDFDGPGWINFMSGLNQMPVWLALINNSGGTAINSLMTCDAFSFKEDSGGNINYEVTLTEFPFNIRNLI